MADVRRNLERKYHCRDLDAVRAGLVPLGTTEAEVRQQRDVFFAVSGGRLKLRTLDGVSATLIWYDRPDAGGDRVCRYHLAPVADAEALHAVLAAACGVCGEVRKRREVRWWHNVRIHLDEVEGLGDFVEFEAVLSADADETTSRQRLDFLARALGLEASGEVFVSYADLLRLE